MPMMRPGDEFVDEPEVNGEPESDNVGTDSSDKSEEIVVSEPVVEPDHVNPTVNNDLQKPLAVSNCAYIFQICLCPMFRCSFFCR